MAQGMASHSNPLLSDTGSFGGLSSFTRKSSPAAGNRSWSEEEETYLLQTRARKMPYKHIAAYLKKTELACRLHYHQLLHGSRRRKRSVSVSSTMSRGSTATLSSTGSSPTPPYRYIANREATDVFGYDPLRYEATPLTTLYSTPKVLLPKPTIPTPPALHVSVLNTTPSFNSNADPNRLRGLHGQQRSTFYPLLSQAYNLNDTLPNLDNTWQHHTMPVTYPPTPDDSPKARIASLRPSSLPTYNPYTLSGTIPNQPVINYTSAPPMGATDRLGGYVSQRTTGEYGCGNLGMHDPWGQGAWTQQKSAESAPTAIASLLTENKCPRGVACSGVNCGHGRY